MRTRKCPPGLGLNDDHNRRRREGEERREGETPAGAGDGDSNEKRERYITPWNQGRWINKDPAFGLDLPVSLLLFSSPFDSSCLMHFK